MYFTICLPNSLIYLYPILYYLLTLHLHLSISLDYYLSLPYRILSLSLPYSYPLPYTSPYYLSISFAICLPICLPYLYPILYYILTLNYIHYPFICFLYSISGTLLNTLNDHKDRVYCLVQLKNGNFASASSDKTIRIWNPFKGNSKYNISIIVISIFHISLCQKTLQIWNYN
jgi:hypothetical protein